MRCEPRNGWHGSCPNGHSYLWTKFLQQAPEPHFYCNHCNNILIRESDAKIVRKAYQDKRVSHADVRDEQLYELWQEALQTAPLCPCGGRFDFWAFARCPHCGIEIPSPWRERQVGNRLRFDYVILVDGALVVADNSEQSYKVIVSPRSEGQTPNVNRLP